MIEHIKHIHPSNQREYVSVSTIHIVDWDAEVYKSIRPSGVGGCSSYSDKIPTLIDGNAPKTVDVNIITEFNVISVGLKKNVWNKSGVGQCDIIVFASQDLENDAILFIETKYTNKDKYLVEYKKKALKQITDTIYELKEIGCPLNKRNLYGLLSFPMLDIEAVAATIFSPAEIVEMFVKNKILIGAGNIAYFENQSKVKFS